MQIYIYSHGLTPAANSALSSHSPATHSPGGWENRRSESEYTHGLWYRQFSRKGTSKAKRINWPLFMGRQVFSPPQDSRAPIHIMVSWEDKCRHSKCPFLPPSSPAFIHWAWCHVGWNIPVITWTELPQLCPLPNPCNPSKTSCWWDTVRSRKGLDTVWALLRES